MRQSFDRFVKWGHLPSDPKEERLKKSSLLVVTGPFALAGIIWGLIYFSQGLIGPGFIPFSYGILSIINIINFGISKKYIFFRNSQLVLILLLPFFLQLSLGGFVQSSAVIYWAIIAPASAMFFDSIRRSVYWFGAYLSLVVIAFLIDDYVLNYVDHELSEGFINALFLGNIIGVSSIVFGILFYFVNTVTNLSNDIEKKNHELAENAAKLKELDVIKSRFFANLSHEFRTPLTIILGLINKQIKEARTSEQQKDSHTIKNSAKRLLFLVNQLLDLSKIESGHVRLKVAKSDILQFVKICTAQFESMAGTKNIQLTFNGHRLDEAIKFEPIRIYFDQEKIQKVLMNLLVNAIKFTPVGGNIAMEVEYQKNEKEHVFIQLANKSETIPEDKLQYIFDRFYQVDSGGNREYEGTGIGLALVKELVELHQGEIKVRSRMQQTTFSIELPANIDTSQDVEILEEDIAFDVSHIETSPDSFFDNVKETVADSKDQTESSQLEILVVEDNDDLRKFISSILKDEYRVLQAKDGGEGFEKAINHIPDLIVSDVMMPKVDGYEFCKMIKQDEKTNHIPLILLTAKVERQHKLEGLDSGADDYLLKPFDEEELKIRIRNLISIREKLQKKYQGEIRLKPRSISVPSVQQAFLENIKDIIEKNLDNESFSVQELGKMAGMSRSQLHRKLKALTNQSATHFVRNYRLYRAADLLVQDAGNITEIAYQVGFNSQSYFSSSFQELFGCSPSEYKQKG